jgi:RHS repeat-associated protein
VVADGTATFTPGISERRSGVSKFLHQDYLGSTKQITSSNQTVTDNRKYDAFGLLQADSTVTTPTPFGFAGGWGYQTDSTGLQLLGHRYYDPSTGRFLTRDPIKDGRNWYGYCDNNPIKFVDSDGKKPRLVIIVGEPLPGESWIEGYGDRLLADCYAEWYGHWYDVDVKVGPTTEEAYDEIRDADAVILIGHGHSGGIRLRGGKKEKDTRDSDIEDTVTPGMIQKVRGGRKLDWVIVVACMAGHKKYHKAWDKVTGDFTGPEGCVTVSDVIKGKAKMPHRIGGGGMRRPW